MYMRYGGAAARRISWRIADTRIVHTYIWVKGGHGGPPLHGTHNTNMKTREQSDFYTIIFQYVVNIGIVERNPHQYKNLIWERMPRILSTFGNECPGFCQHLGTNAPDFVNIWKRMPRRGGPPCPPCFRVHHVHGYDVLLRWV